MNTYTAFASRLVWHRRRAPGGPRWVRDKDGTLAPHSIGEDAKGLGEFDAAHPLGWTATTSQKCGAKPRHKTPMNQTIRGCVQQTEKAEVVAAAVRAGQSESQWVRDAALRSLPHEGPPPTDRAVLVTWTREGHTSVLLAVCSWSGNCWRVFWAGASTCEHWNETSWPAAYRWRDVTR